MKKRTIQEWEKHFDTLIMDADGFPPHTNRNQTLFTEQEFLEYARKSTLRFSDKLLQSWERKIL